jgi:hypothetical protein
VSRGRHSPKFRRSTSEWAGAQNGSRRSAATSIIEPARSPTRPARECRPLLCGHEVRFGRRADGHPERRSCTNNSSILSWYRRMAGAVYCSGAHAEVSRVPGRVSPKFQSQKEGLPRRSKHLCRLCLPVSGYILISRSASACSASASVTWRNVVCFESPTTTHVFRQRVPR